MSPISLIKLALLLYLLPLVFSRSGRRGREDSDLPEPFIYSSEVLNNWEAPPFVSRALPYYLVGYDKKGRPVFIAEMSKWDILGLTSTEEGRMLCRLAMEQLVFRLGGKSSWTDGTEGFVLIEQSENFNVSQLSGPYTIPAWMYGIQLLESLVEKHQSNPNIITINGNCAKETLVGLAQLATTTIGQYMEPYGTDKAAWTARILELCPEDQIPPEYGGSDDWKLIRSNQA